MSVIYIANRKKFMVRAQRNGKREFGGYFDNIEAAHAAHEDLVRKLTLQTTPPVIVRGEIPSLEKFDLAYENEDYLPFRLPSPTRLEVVWGKVRGWLFSSWYEKELDRIVKIK